MDDMIREEQLKLANHFKGLSADERQKQGFALMCYLQGYEAGYQSALQSEKKSGRKDG